MTSGYSPDLLYGGGNSGRSSLSSASSLAGMSSFRQPQQQQQQPLSSQQQPQQGMMFEQIAQRRADLLMGKRSFGDYQAYQQQILLQQQQQQLQRQQQQQQQQQQNPLLFLQKQQQQQPQSHQQLSYLHQQYLMRSVKQRTNSFSSSPISPLSPSIDLCSPTSNNNTNNSLSSPSAARFGVPIYQQVREQQQQQTISLLSNNHIPNNNNNNFSNNNNNNNNNNQFINNNQFNPTNKCLIPNLSTTTTNNNSLMIPIQNSGPGMSSRGYPNYGQNLFQPKPEPQTEAAGGYSNYGQNLVQPKPEPQPEAAGGYSNYGQNLVQPKLEPQPEAAGGYSNYGHNLVQPKLEPQPEAAGGYLNSVEPKVEPDLEDQKILDSLHELEKQLLNDDNDEENDDVSVITNSEWSETFQNLMSSSGSRNPNPNPSPGLSPSPSPNTNHACSSTSGSNNNVNNNNMISPSPTSSTSSCCSTSTPQPQQQPETLSVNQLISEAAAAIAENKGEPGISELLARLARISNSKGDNHQRLGFFMGHALRTRACPSETPAPVRELYSEDQMQAMYSLYNISPCFKFGLLAANLVMLEAITSALQEGSKVHVIDFEIGQGAQYINLLRALAERRSQVGATTEGGCSPYELKVTVVETELTNRGVMESVKDGLVKLASRVGIILKFEGLTRKITELTRESLGCEDGEAIVVNFAFRLYRIPDESVSMENLRDELLRRVKGLSPRAVTLVEQEMNGNTAPFMNRVNESCVYYGALFDSLEATLHREHKERIRVEEGLGRKMANSVACEGRERVERPEVFGKWRARMGMAGFELKAISPSVAESMRAKLNSARGGNPGFTVKEESGGVGFGWKGRTLTVASAWR